MMNEEEQREFDEWYAHTYMGALERAGNALHLLLDTFSETFIVYYERFVDRLNDFLKQLKRK